ncbi:CART protein, partial [Mohoua ochrocephala]|nr:CART protein [Mohoua ochrocephala]
TGNMENARLCLLCLLGSGLILLGTPEPVPAPTLSLPGQSREETELVRGWGSGEGGPRHLLGGFGAGTPKPQPPGLTVPSPQCEPREPCAVRRGARIGKLCSCPRGTSCNLFILKCS